MILLINNHSGKIYEISKVLKKLHTEYTIRDQKSNLSKINKSSISGVILSGGGLQLDKKIKFNQIRADIASIMRFNVPILGICLGHEIIAEAFGGEIVKLRKEEIDSNLNVRILKKSKIFKGLPNYMEADEQHSRYVRDLPKEFIVTAHSKRDKIEAFFHKKKPIFGVQFHPEDSGIIGEQIIKNFLDICKKHKK